MAILISGLLFGFYPQKGKSERVLAMHEKSIAG